MLDDARVSENTGNFTHAFKLYKAGAYRISLVLEELQNGDPRIEQFSTHVAIANSWAEQLMASGFSVSPDHPSSDVFVTDDEAADTRAASK